MSGTRLILLVHQGGTMSEQQKRVYLKLDKKVGEMTDEELKEYSDEVYARIIALFRGEKNG